MKASKTEIKLRQELQMVVEIITADNHKLLNSIRIKKKKK